MKTKTIIALLALTLAACTPAQATPAINLTEVQNIAIAAAWTDVALTQTAISASTPETTPSTIILPTPYPTNPPAIVITPDPIQVAKWREYQTELAKALLPQDPIEHVLCEWVILGRSDQDLYVLAVCSGSGRATAPTVISTSTDGSIKNVEDVEYGSIRNIEIQRLFPPDIQEMIFSGSFQMPFEQLKEHLSYRGTHRDVPPLIILSAMPTATPTP